MINVLVHKRDVVVIDIELEYPTASTALGIDVLVDSRVGNGVKAKAPSRSNEVRKVKGANLLSIGNVNLKKKRLASRGGEPAIAKGAIFIPKQLAVEWKERMRLDFRLHRVKVLEIDHVEMTIAITVRPEFVPAFAKDKKVFEC